jgi:hypothetical protein
MEDAPTGIAPNFIEHTIPPLQKGGVQLKGSTLSFWVYLMSFLICRRNTVSVGRMGTNDDRRRMWKWVVVLYFKEMQTQRNIRKPSGKCPDWCCTWKLPNTSRTATSLWLSAWNLWIKRFYLNNPDIISCACSAFGLQNYETCLTQNEKTVQDALMFTIWLSILWRHFLTPWDAVYFILNLRGEWLTVKYFHRIWIQGTMILNMRPYCSLQITI